MAFSSTVKASELKNSIVTSKTQPMTSRCARKLRQLTDDDAGLARRQPADVAAQRASSAAWSITCDSAIAIRISSGTIDSKRIVGHGAGQQQALVGAKALEHLQRESAGVAQHIGRLRVKVHGVGPANGGGSEKAGFHYARQAAAPASPSARTGVGGYA